MYLLHHSMLRGQQCKSAAKLTPCYEGNFENISVLQEIRYAQNNHQFKIQVDGFCSHQEERDQQEVVEQASSNCTQWLRLGGVQTDDEHDVDAKQSKGEVQ